jgi:predicted XRE-type DNA-binding protein
MYQLLFGPISDGLVVRHHCDRRDCINPCHLDVGTVAHNNADTMARGRNRNLRGNENGRSRLTEQQIPQIRFLLKECKLSQRQVAEQFEVSEPLIGRISRGEIWKHVIARGAARDSWV